MEIRLNKLISEAGVCSRREADNFIEMERVTVNGKQPHVGQKVTAEDVVLVDGERLNVEKYIRLQEEEKKEMQQEKNYSARSGKRNPRTREAVKALKWRSSESSINTLPPVRRRKRRLEIQDRQAYRRGEVIARCLTPQVRKGTEQIGGGATDRRQPEIGRPSEDEQEQPDQQGETCRPPEKQESRRR